MDDERVLATLLALRREWEANMRVPYYRERAEWVRGVLKGIDLAIMRVTDPKREPQSNSGAWLWALFVLTVAGGLVAWFLSLR